MDTWNCRQKELGTKHSFCTRVESSQKVDPYVIKSAEKILKYTFTLYFCVCFAELCIYLAEK